MTAQHDKPKWWRPRFSVRALVVVVTLACFYAACWGLTKERGVQDVPRRAFRGTIGLSSGIADEDAEMISHFYRSFNASPVLPLVVGIDWEFDSEPTRRYYFWFFGYVAKLPYERELPRDNPQPLDEIIRKLKDEVSGRGGWENHFEDTDEIRRDSGLAIRSRHVPSTLGHYRAVRPAQITSQANNT